MIHKNSQNGNTLKRLMWEQWQSSKLNYSNNQLIHVDFGEIGIKKISAQITKNYNLKELLGQQIIGKIYLTHKKIANIQSEFLLLGAIN
jgi:tRNA-binding EMAP/Myf-like protein